MEESFDAAEQLCFDEKIELLAAAFVNLPRRCREIMTLRKLSERRSPNGVCLVPVWHNVDVGGFVTGSRWS